MDDLKPEQLQQTARPTRPPAQSPKSSRRLFWGGAIVILLIGAIAWGLHDRGQPPARSGRAAATGPTPVAVATVEKGDIRITYDALGTVTALQTVTVQAQIAGQLTDVAFQEGQDVKKGDFLAQIDPRPYQAALDQSQGTQQRDQAGLEEARMDLNRYQRLAVQNSIARQQSEDQVFVVQQDEGTVKLDQALVDNAKINLGYAHIVSPVTGRIGLRLVDPGNYVQVGNATASATGSSTGTATGIAVITQMQPISVLFTLPEDELPAVMKRLRAGAKLSVAAYDRGGDTKLADGTLSAVDSEIDTTTGTVKLRAEFANSDESLFPNQFVNAELLIDTLQDATVIPSAGVQRGQPGTFVFVVQPDNTVSLRPIKLGPQDGERVAVLSGLSVGDRIVIDGADKLRNGASIAIRRKSQNGRGSGNTTADAGADAGAAGTGAGGVQTPSSSTTPQSQSDPQPGKRKDHKKQEHSDAGQ